MVDLPANIRKILLKICQRHERRGTLSGVMKLGQSLPEGELRAIENFFGLRPLIKSVSKDEVKLSFDRLLAGKSEEEVRAWLSEIYQLLGREITEPVSPKEDDLHLLLEQLRLAFPRLGPVHRFLRREKGSLAGKFRGSGAEIRELFFTCARIVDFLLGNEEAVTLSDLGARFCGGSKALRQGRLKNMVEQWLGLMRPDLPEGAGVWQEFLVVRDRLTIHAVIYGPIIYQKGGREYDWINQLYLAGEPALVSWFHLEGVTSLRLAGEGRKESILTTCENEAPFSLLLREKPKGIILFTAGFPNRAVRKLYQLLAPLCVCRHWGDSDVAGLRIAAILHDICPLTLWRCDLAAIKKSKEKLLPLEKSQVEVAASLLDERPDFQFKKELIFTLKHGWLEQESWQPDNSGC
jgi:hypothetical protein